MTYSMQKTDEGHMRRRVVAVRGDKRHTMQSHLHSDAVTTMSDEINVQKTNKQKTMYYCIFQS